MQGTEHIMYHPVKTIFFRVEKGAFPLYWQHWCDVGNRRISENGIQEKEEGGSPRA
jgi:hypothetical protein